MSLAAVVGTILEKAAKPGVMSLAAEVLERKTARALASYFRIVSRRLTTQLSKLGDAENRETAVHTAHMIVSSVVRRYSHTLLEILVMFKMEAMMKADRQNVFHEAANDKIGLSAKEAAEYAADSAAKSVTGINAKTIERYEKAVSDAILEQRGVDGLARILRELSDDLSVVRSITIAATEMADAFGEAALRKLKREGIEFKQAIPSPGACEYCLDIIAGGSIPVDEDFEGEDGETFDRTPFHVNCRCATVGARGI